MGDGFSDLSLGLVGLLGHGRLHLAGGNHDPVILTTYLNDIAAAENRNIFDSGTISVPCNLNGPTLLLTRVSASTRVISNPTLKRKQTRKLRT